jgi:hypothetical protein
MISLCPAINLVAECMTISVGKNYQLQKCKVWTLMIKTNVLLSLYFERWGIDIEIRTEI